MRTLKKIFTNIIDGARRESDNFEQSLNWTIREALWEKYKGEHPLPESYHGNVYASWRQDGVNYMDLNFKPVEMSAEDKEKIAKNHRTESYLNAARRGIATVLISAPLIFSVGSCISCTTDPNYRALMHKEGKLSELDRKIRGVNNFVWDAERDSSESIPYRATPEEVGVMKKRLENLTSYRDSVENSPEYARLEEISDSLTSKGWINYTAGIIVSIGMGFISGYLERVIEKNRKRKNDAIGAKYLPKETQ